MTVKEIEELQKCIDSISDEDLKDNANFLLSKARTEAYAQKMKQKLVVAPTEAAGNGSGTIQFTSKEAAQMPEEVRKYIAGGLKPVGYRFHKGVYEIRYRRDGYEIDVSSKDFNIVKRRFLTALSLGPTRCVSKLPTFTEYSETWLKAKKPMIKESTYNTYVEQLKLYLLPYLGDMTIDRITRDTVQNLLYGYVEEGKSARADKCKKLLGAIFDLAVADFDIRNPMLRITLPHYEQKKSFAFRVDQEKTIVDYCIGHPETKGTSALLVLLYTGMRVGELKSMTWDDKFVYCVSEKTRMGYADVTRKIPLSPMLKNVLPYIDFEMAKAASPRTIRDVLEKTFPERHLHELRYTFITRAKECGINPEVVMLMDGHKQDRDCRTSLVDRGYTDYSDEFIIKEMEKFKYEFDGDPSES